MSVAGVFRQLGLAVFERGWLSSNNIVFGAVRGAPATVVDTGYDAHAVQTVELLRAHLGAIPVERVVNTHLHSDHCGGNHALQRRWHGCETWVPDASFDAAAAWDETRLSFRDTDQRCQRFDVSRGLAAGEAIRLGAYVWQVVAAPGHDPLAVMFFEPQSRTLISADALWEDRLAIIFPELDGEPGFGDTLAALDVIARLGPAIVIPGHGRPFTDAAVALRRSRERVAQFSADPQRHLRYATRALAMFHMLEVRECARDELVDWLTATPIFVRVLERQSTPAEDRSGAARRLVDALLADGLLHSPESNRVAIS